MSCGAQRALTWFCDTSGDRRGSQYFKVHLHPWHSMQLCSVLVQPRSRAPMLHAGLQYALDDRTIAARYTLCTM
eukprot:3836723-Pleurochrysis_carterae.AAC.1